MGFPPSFLDDLRTRVSLNQLAGRHISLTQHGTEFKGLCPFHSEKTPSFTINEEKGFFHCFGCEAHGDIFGFVMQLEGLSFVEAVERIANECGITMPAWSADADSQRGRRKTLIETNELATTWFEAQLRAPAGKLARQYLSARGLDGATARHFRLGYAPNSSSTLSNYMVEQKVTPSNLLASGLVRQPEDGRKPYDFFRGRIIFPIIDRTKKVIGFGGRTLGTGEPKYINSPETDLFRKGLTLYNLSNAVSARSQSSVVIVAEGYMDVIALHRTGLNCSVAPLGTALTNEQITQLWRLSPDPLVCFDGDSAGQKAAYRAAARALPLLKPGHSLSFVFLPSGHDPDSLVLEDRVPELQELIKSPVTLVDFIWNQLRVQQPIDTPERQAAFKQNLRKLALSITDRTVQRGYLTEFKKRVDQLFAYTPLFFGNKKRSTQWDSSALLKNHSLGKNRSGDPEHRERVLIATLIGHPELIKDVREDFLKIQIRSPKLQSLKASLLDAWGRDPTIDYSRARVELTNKGHGEIIALLFDRTGWNQTIIEPSIRPESDAETALLAWKETLAIHQEETGRPEP